eukprot:gene9414-11078_t
MSAHYDLVGRLAQLHNIESKPELNQVYVLIQAYLPAIDQFSVRTLPSHDSNKDTVTIAVKLDSMALCTPERYSDNYPNSREVQVDSLEKELHDQPHGTTLNLKLARVSNDNLLVNKSYRFVGEKVPLNGAGLPEPVAKQIGHAQICPFSDDAIIEFEDIHFIGPESCRQGHMLCIRGRVTIFRRCVFSNTGIVVAGTNPSFPTKQGQRVSEIVGTPDVVFESCVIDVGTVTAESVGLCVGKDGTATLLNCVIRNCGTGITTIAGSRLIMKHCKIETGIVGLSVEEKTKSVDLLHCSVLSTPQISGCGITINAAGPVVLQGCRVENFNRIGIYLLGKSKHVSRVTIAGCRVTGCRTGVRFELGEFSTSINATSLQSNGCGLYILPTAIGTIAVAQCDIANNKVHNIVNLSAAKDMLTVDGVVEEAASPRRPYQIPTELAARRCGQQAGLCDINCLKKEETGENAAAIAMAREFKRFQEGTVSADEALESLAKFKARLECSELKRRSDLCK